jgi:NADPH-dependent 7-cyano-7-deazaguanine reductase QueF
VGGESLFLRKLEATGVYHERCAEWLFNTGFKVSVVNPAYIKYYGQSLGVITINIYLEKTGPTPGIVSKRA